MRIQPLLMSLDYNTTMQLFSNRSSYKKWTILVNFIFKLDFLGVNAAAVQQQNLIVVKVHVSKYELTWGQQEWLFWGQTAC